MLELTSSCAATSDRLEAELATVCRIVSTISATDDRQTLERYRAEIEAELARLQRDRLGLTFPATVPDSRQNAIAARSVA